MKREKPVTNVKSLARALNRRGYDMARRYTATYDIIDRRTGKRILMLKVVDRSSHELKNALTRLRHLGIHLPH